MTMYDSFVDEIIKDFGLDATWIGSSWSWIEREQKSYIFLLIFGITGAFMIAGTLSITYALIVLEIVGYLYSQNIF